jgi:hypothetical protein
MKSNRKRARRRENALRVWSYDQACQALPYVTSVMTSVREHWIEAHTHDRRARELAALPGRPDRKRILAETDEADQAREARGQFEEAADELHGLDIFCIDPLRGEGVIPFVHKEQLAWFLYDLFAPDTLRYWRYHNDPLDSRRPIDEALSDETTQVA